MKKAILLLEDSCFSWKQRSDVWKTSWWIFFFQTCSFSLHKTLTDGLEWCGVLWGFHQLFGLILRAPIHCRGSIGEKKNIHICHALKCCKMWCLCNFILTLNWSSCLWGWNGWTYKWQKRLANNCICNWKQEKVCWFYLINDFLLLSMFLSQSGNFPPERFILTVGESQKDEI